MRRNVLVIGSTGKQGVALIRALLDPPPSAQEPPQYHIYALTRKPSSPIAQRLAERENVTVVEGDLDDVDSLAKIFENAKEDDGIWGVFVALAFPGLGANADGEERQGIVSLQNKGIRKRRVADRIAVTRRSRAALWGPGIHLLELVACWREV